LRHTAPPPRECDSLVVTHPFHPLVGQRVPVLYERHCRSTLRRVYVCDGGTLGIFFLPEGFTDRADPDTAAPLTVDCLTALAAIVAALQQPLTEPNERRTSPCISMSLK
jgi:hypothetical protein